MVKTNYKVGDLVVVKVYNVIGVIVEREDIEVLSNQYVIGIKYEGIVNDSWYLVASNEDLIEYSNTTEVLYGPFKENL